MKSMLYLAALAPLTLVAQDAPAPAPAPAPAAEVAPASDNAVAEIMEELTASMEELVTVFEGITDKASADAAVAKIQTINDKADAVQKRMESMPEPSPEAIQAAQQAVMGRIMASMAKMEAALGTISEEDFYGSEDLKGFINTMGGGEDIEIDVEEVEED